MDISTSRKNNPISPANTGPCLQTMSALLKAENTADTTDNNFKVNMGCKNARQSAKLFWVSFKVFEITKRNSELIFFLKYSTKYTYIKSDAVIG